MRNRSKKGFTLIELLIVIAIIGILAAVLIPNLLGARVRAFNTAAQTCAKGIATAAEIFQIDNRTYSGLTITDVQANGGNSCTSAVTVSGLPLTTATTYSVTASHTQGNQTYTVTPGGISP